MTRVLENRGPGGEPTELPRFAALLRKHRGRRSLQDLGAATEIHHSNIGRAENGARTLGPANVRRLAEVLELPEDERLELLDAHAEHHRHVGVEGLEPGERREIVRAADEAHRRRGPSVAEKHRRLPLAQRDKPGRGPCDCGSHHGAIAPGAGEKRERCTHYGECLGAFARRHNGEGHCPRDCNRWSGT